MEILPTCECLEKHSDLLCHLKRHERGPLTPSVEAVLLSVQQALVIWQDFINCCVCATDNLQTVSVLSFLSMRSVLHGLELLRSVQDSRSVAMSGCSPLEQQSRSSGKLKFGSYEATSNEEKLVTDVLVDHALSRIKCTLVSLKEKCSQSRDQQPQFQTILAGSHGGHQSPRTYQEANAGCIQQLFQTLERMIQAVEGSATSQK